MKNFKSQKNSGFTLIETLLYIALFGIIMGGVAAATYSIVEASGRSQTRVNLQEEGGFLLAKINWALNDASAISVQALPPVLTVNKYNFSSNPLVFNLATAHLTLKEGVGISENLNSDSVAVTNLIFQDIPALGSKPQGIKTMFRLESKTPKGQIITQDFESVEYLHK